MLKCRAVDTLVSACSSARAVQQKRDERKLEEKAKRDAEKQRKAESRLRKAEELKQKRKEAAAKIRQEKAAHKAAQKARVKAAAQAKRDAKPRKRAKKQAAKGASDLAKSSTGASESPANDANGSSTGTKRSAEEEPLVETNSGAPGNPVAGEIKSPRLDLGQQSQGSSAANADPPMPKGTRNPAAHDAEPSAGMSPSTGSTVVV